MTIPVRKGALVCGVVNVVCDAVGIVWWCGGVCCVVQRDVVGVLCGWI